MQFRGLISIGSFGVKALLTNSKLEKEEEHLKNLLQQKIEREKIWWEFFSPISLFFVIARKGNSNSCNF